MSAPRLGRAPAAVVASATVDRVDLWRVPLVATPEALRVAAGDLTSDERSFASRLRAGGDRYVLARSALRRRLAAELDVGPRDVELVAGAFGKPELASGHASELRFNLAHSDAFALIAVRRGADVGVDLERVRDDVDVAGIARAVFTPRERAAWHALGGPEDPKAFFRVWVQHEALAKATGGGFVEPEPTRGDLVVCEVGGIPAHFAAVASIGPGWSVRCGWSTRRLSTAERPEPDFAASAG